MSAKVTVFWFRRDLRLEDNAGLYHALKENGQVLPLFIFDTEILEQLTDKEDKRVAFIHQEIKLLDHDLQVLGSHLLVKSGTPEKVFNEVLNEFTVGKVIANHDYEPYARKRDMEVAQLLKAKGVDFKTYKDQCIFEKSEIVKDNGEPYTVYTPYSKKWKARLKAFYLKPYPVKKYFSAFLKWNGSPVPSLQQIGFRESTADFPSNKINGEIVHNYHKTRDIPALRGTSRLGLHLRFGTISIRKLAQYASEENETYLGELIWREFYMMILWHFPQVEHHAFRPAYDRIHWRNNEVEFKAWCEGKTGYPLVDAGMRELNETGFMHNRVRMVTASFLTKHLLVDWRWGERYFAEKLLDYDLAANNGSWQWVAGSGTDAAPYFRIFNPALQTKRFDPKGEYIRKWVPEVAEDSYPRPIVDHEFARKRCLEVYKKALTP